MANQPSKYSKFLVGAASAALVASAVAPVASAADFSDVKGNTHEDAINSLVKAGVISGYPDGSFLPNKTLTRSDVVKMMGKLLVSLGNEVPTDYKTNPRFTDQTSKTNDELLQASALVKDHGVFNGLENGSLDAAGDITRENMAIVLVRAYDAINKTDLVAYVKEQEFKKDVTDLATAKAEARPYIDVLDFFDITNPVNPTFNPKDTTTRGQFASFLFKTTAVESPAEKVTTATKVESVTATNLVEVVIAFDGSVDTATATDKENYEINGKVIKSASLSEDAKSVTLTLDTANSNTAMTNQTEYKLTFSNVKAGDKEISVKEFKFTPVDTTLPSVASVTALGNQTLSVKFSEPVKTANTSNFTIDGKTVVGEAKVSGRTVIVKLYTALEDGEHTVAVKDVVDFNNTKSLNVEEKFTVVKDDTAPTIDSVVKASFEKVTIKFSEQVDPATVTTTSAYWLQGTSKKYPGAVTQVSEDTFEFDFSNNKIQYTTDLYITGVKDYSSNVIAADSKIQVNPVIDQTRPEVSSLVYDAATKSFTVKFNKTVDEASAEKAANYVVKNSAGTVVSKFKTATLNLTNNKEVTVQLVDALTAGSTYTVEVAGVSDNTTLKNVMMPFTKTITVADITEPTVSSVIRNTDNNTLVVNFNKKMAVNGDGSIVDKAKYFYSTQASNVTPTDWKALPSGSSVNVSPDGKSAIIQLPTSEVLVLNINHLRVQLVKDDKGNYLDKLTLDKPVVAQTPVTYDAVTATDNNKVVLTFSRALLANTLNSNDFTVKSGNQTLNVLSTSLNSAGTKVTLTLADSNLLTDDAKYGTSPAAVSVDVKATATTSTVDGTKISSGSRVVTDSISAEVKSVSGATGNGIDVTFGEALATVAGSEDTDFIITDEDDVKLVPGTDYTVSTSGAVATIAFKPALQGVKAVYSVSINPRFLKDAPAGNLVEAVSAADAIDVYVADTTAATAPTLTAATLKGSVAHTITAVPAGETAWLAPAGTTNFVAGAKMTSAAAGATSILSPADEGVYNLFLVDAEGNISPASTDSLTVDNTVAAAGSLVAKAGLLEITGTAEVGAEIKVYAVASAGAAIATSGGTAVTVASNGTFTWTAGSALTASTAYYVEVTDVAGNVSTRASVTTPGA